MALDDAVQQALEGRGYDVGGADGSYGGRTEQAVRFFQRDQQLNVDGVVDAGALFVWEGGAMFESAAWFEARSFDAGLIYREQHRDVDSVLFRAFLDDGERLGLWVRLDGATLLAVCTI